MRRSIHALHASVPRAHNRFLLPTVPYHGKPDQDDLHGARLLGSTFKTSCPHLGPGTTSEYRLLGIFGPYTNATLHLPTEEFLIM